MRAPRLGPLNSLLCRIGWHRRGGSRPPVKGRKRAKCRMCGAMLEQRGIWRTVR